MRFVKAAQTSEFENENRKLIKIDGREILLIKIQDTYYAIDNRCTHMGGSLFDGNLEGSNIVCPRHGSEYDIRTGEVVKRGRLFGINVKVRDLNKYEVRTEGNDILIGLE